MGKKQGEKSWRGREITPQEAYERFFMQQMGERPVTEQVFERRITERSQEESSELVAIKQENRHVQQARQSLLRRKI